MSNSTTMPAVIDAVFTQVDTTNIATVSAQNLEILAAQTMNEERDQLHHALGALSAVGMFQRISLVTQTVKLAEIKSKKLYRSLKGNRAEDGRILSGTWEEACHIVGISREQADLNIIHLRTFGEEALEALHSAGVGYRELRQLRSLPDDERQALITAAAADDKETLLATAEDLLSRHRKEKKLLKETLGGMKADLEAKEKILAERNKELLSTKDKLVFIQSSKRIEANAIRSEVAGLIVTIRQQLTVQLNEGFTRLLAAATENANEDTIDILQDEVKAFMAEQVMYMRMAVARLQEDFDLPDDPAEVGGPPAWMSADMDVLEAEIEAQKPEHLKSSAPVEQISADDKAGRTAGRRKPAVVAGTEA